MDECLLDRLREAINETAYGGAICFLGAGFSRGGSDSRGNPIPSTTGLEVEIRKIARLSDNDDSKLSDLADYCEATAEGASQLKSLLIDRLTFCSPTKTQIDVINIPWRAIFTTNFDDIPERALHSRTHVSVSPLGDNKKLSTSSLPIYYLHGRARDLCDGHIDPSIVLSERNYLMLKEKNQNLYSTLENEVYTATKVFFIGYSLKDAEIASRLFSIQNLKEKAIVITGSDASIVEISRLKKFGTPYAIGCEEFAKLLPDPSDLAVMASKAPSYQFLKRISLPPASPEVSIRDVDRLLLSGEFSLPAFATQQRAIGRRAEYSVFRQSAILEIFDAPLHGANIVMLSSDLGNGKSITLQQAIHEASVRGYEVFVVDSLVTETFVELDSALSSLGRCIYVVDGVARYARAIRHIAAHLPANCILLIADRDSSKGLVDKNIFDFSTQKLRDIDLNTLGDTELSDWNSFLERWGFWQERIEDNEVDRIKFLRVECNRENRAIVLALFKGARLSGKISDIVEFFLNQNKQHSKAFVAVLINSLCQKHVNWDRISDWLDIDSGSFKAAVLKSPINDFMTDRRNWHDFSSTQMADFIFGRFDFLLEDIVSVYTKIVRETAYSANDPRSGFDARENLKELMRFRFLTRLLARRQDSAEAISAVYHRLSNVPRIRDNDQFWLQYAMARMEVGDLDNAETYLNTAFGLANKKGLDYSKHQLSDQRARLFFKKNSKRNYRINVSEMHIAISDLVSLLNGPKEDIVHPLRSAEHILSFLEARADDLNRPLISEITDVIDLMRSMIPSGNLHKAQRGETAKLRRQIRDCKLILSNL